MVQYTTRTRCSGAIPPHLHVLLLTCKIDDVNSLPPEYGICGRQAGRTGPLLVPICITLLSSCQVPVLVERATDNLHWTVEVVESRVKLSPACSNAASILNRVCPDLACPPGACPHSLAADPQPVIFIFFSFFIFSLSSFCCCTIACTCTTTLRLRPSLRPSCSPRPAKARIPVIYTSPSLLFV